MFIGLMSFLGYFMNSYIKENRSNLDIIDEMKLVRRQLKDLIRIGSQSREYLFNLRTSYLQLEIDLKLTEAEDIISRVNKIRSMTEDKYQGDSYYDDQNRYKHSNEGIYRNRPINEDQNLRD